MKKNWMKQMALVMVLVLCMAAVIGCGNKEEGTAAPETSAPATGETKEEAPATEDKMLIGFSSKQMSNPFQNELIMGAENAIDKSKVEFTVVDADSNAAKQLNDFQDLIQMKCDVILFVPYDSSGLESVLKEAHEAGIFLVNLDNKVDETSLQYVDVVIVSDNYQAGELCAEKLGEGLDSKGDIGAYTVPTSVASIDRSSGFFDKIEADYPDIEVVNSQTGAAGSTDVALPVMENILQGTPDIVGMFGYCDTASLGCVSALKAANKIDQVKVVSVDGSTDGKTAIKAGELYGSAAQFPGKISEMGVEAAYALMNGEKVEKMTKIQTEWVSLENVDEVKNFSGD